MSKALTTRRLRRKQRIRAKVSGTAERPRLAVNLSLTSISAQVIDDTKGHTLASAHSAEAKAKGKGMDAAKKVGALIAKKATDAKVKAVVFDRAGRKYHGRVKALADAAREGGLQF